MLQVSDLKIFELTKLLYNAFKHDDQAQRLDPEQLAEFKKENIKPLYPHKREEDKIVKYTCNEACCLVDPGRFCCANTTKPDSSFQKLGLGLCLYFKFMKHSTIVFLIISILTLMSCLICLLVGNQNGFSPTSNYQTFLFSTTLGVFSSERVKCQYQKLSNSSALNTNLSIALTCPYGQVKQIGATYSYQSSNTLYNCKTEARRFESGDLAYLVNNNVYNSTCSSKKSCVIQIASLAIVNNFTTVAFSYQCINQVYSLGIYQIKSQYLFYIVVGIDLIALIILISFYYSQGRAEEREIKYFKLSQLSLNDFSLKITGFNITTFDEEFNVIVRQLTGLIGNEFADEVVQVKTPDRIDFVQYQNAKNEAYEQLYQFIVEQFFDHEINPLEFKSEEDFMDRNFQSGEYDTYRMNLLKLVENYHFLEYKPDQQKSSKVCSIFIVLNTIGMRKRIYEMQKDGCFKKYFSFGNKQYVLSDPPQPDLIIWQNKGRLTFIRFILSWIITLVICMASYLLFGWIQYQQNNYLSKYNFNIDCGVLFPNYLFTETQLNNNQGNSNYLTCYCLNSYTNFRSNTCTQFSKLYISYIAIPAIISLLLVLYNVVVSTFFKLVTKFECHRLITAELLSYTIKRSFLLVMNMALIMIILNMKYSTTIEATQFSFLLQGKYNDISPDWYMNIGSIIILTMIFNITFPIIELLLANILKCLKRCWDTKLYCKKTSCKTKKQYISLYSNDVYPLEQRYAFLISIIIITLSFSCVIPLLYFICAISFMLLYFADKLLVLKAYQTPPNYGPELHRLINKTIFLGLIAHLSLSAYFLSQSALLAPNSSIALYSSFDTHNQRINKMITVYYILPYVALFLLFVGWSVFNNTLVALCDKCLLLCKKNLSHITRYKLQQTFYDILSPYQLLKLKLMTQSQLSKLTAKANAYRSIRGNKSQLDETMKGLHLKLKSNQVAPEAVSEHQSILRRTFMKIRAEETLRKRQTQFGDINLIGQPSYEIMVNDQAFEQNKKNNMLSSSLADLLKQELQILYQ